MSEEITTSQEADEELPPQDLRTVLLQDLTERFTSVLTSNNSVPAAAREALVELLNSDSPTATDIINAISENDPGEEETEND